MSLVAGRCRAGVRRVQGPAASRPPGQRLCAARPPELGLCVARLPGLGHRCLALSGSVAGAAGTAGALRRKAAGTALHEFIGIYGAGEGMPV